VDRAILADRRLFLASSRRPALVSLILTAEPSAAGIAKLAAPSTRTRSLVRFRPGARRATGAVVATVIVPVTSNGFWFQTGRVTTPFLDTTSVRAAGATARVGGGSGSSAGG
jgi:hypothetical protein